MATHKIKADLDVDGEVQGTSLDINGNADISGNLTGLDQVNSTTYIIGGHTINDIDRAGEFVDSSEHILTSAAAKDYFAQINANTTGSSGSCTGNAATATTLATARNIGGVSFNGSAAINLPGVNTGGNQDTTGTAAQANNLQAFDDRDMAPEDLSYSDDLKLFFSAKEGLEDGTSTGSDWQDVLVLNSYSDSSGGNANILAFDKSAQKIRHYQAGLSASNWGTAKELAYTDSDISGNTSGTAAIATTITVADESSDTSCNVLFATAATGNLAPKSGTNLTFNSSSGVLTATGFAGALTGNVTGNCSGTAATVTGAAQTNITSLGTLSSVTVSGNINANGNIVGDDSTSITNIDNIQLDNVMADADTTTRIGLGSTSMEFLVADSDVMDLNETTLNVSGTLVAKKHKLAKTSNTDGNADGDIVYFGATTSMDTGKIYYFNSSGNWALADADAESTAKGMLGVALGAASDTNGVLIRGMVTLDTDPGTIGDTLFLSTTAGVATSTAPSGNGDIVRVIGYCLDSTNGQIYFNPDGTFVEVTA